jgi:hypothetical protein
MASLCTSGTPLLGGELSLRERAVRMYSDAEAALGRRDVHAAVWDAVQAQRATSALDIFVTMDDALRIAVAGAGRGVSVIAQQQVLAAGLRALHQCEIDVANGVRYAPKDAARADAATERLACVLHCLARLHVALQAALPAGAGASMGASSGAAAVEYMQRALQLLRDVRALGRAGATAYVAVCVSLALLQWEEGTARAREKAVLLAGESAKGLRVCAQTVPEDEDEKVDGGNGGLARAMAHPLRDVLIELRDVLVRIGVDGSKLTVWGEMPLRHALDAAATDVVTTVAPLVEKARK